MGLKLRCDDLRTYEHVRHGDLDWTVHSEWKDRLLGDSGMNWTTIADEPRAKQIKVGDGREIWRVALDATTDVYVKLQERADEGLSRMARAVGASAGAREANNLLRAAMRGVPAARLLAYGRESSPLRREWLIMEGLQDARRLSDHWLRKNDDDVHPRFKQQRGLIQTIAEFFARAHEIGFLHRDPHPANILIRRSATQTEAFFVDLQSASVGRKPINMKRSIGEVAGLYQWAKRHTTKAQRLRFLRAYLRRRAHVLPEYLGRPGERLLAQQIVDANFMHAARLARKRDQRLRRHGKYFGRINLPHGWSATVALILERREVFPEHSVPDRTLDQWRDAMTTQIATLQDRKQSARAKNQVSGTSPFLGLKNRLVSLWWTISGSPARKSFRHSHQLRHRDIAAPLILGYIERRGPLGMIEEAALVTPEIALQAAANPLPVPENAGSLEPARA